MIVMKVESRVNDITRELLQMSNNTGVAVRRLRSGTSDSSGDSTRKPITVENTASNDEAVSFAMPASVTIDVHKAIEQLNEFMRAQRRDVTFSVHEETKTTVIRVFKHETGELIKQIPPEEILAMVSKIRKNIGWLVDKKA